MATLRKGFAILVLLLCLGVQVRAAEMWRNLEDLGGFDGYISSATPNSFTDNETLLVTYLDATRWSFLRFNVSSLPDASQVQSVKLWLWTEYPGINIRPAAMWMHPLYVPFNSTTTWNNRNISVYAGATNVPVSGWNSWTVIDITQYYQKWRTGQWVNHGIIFSPNLVQVQFFNWFASANYATAAAKKPRIQVTYTGSATPVQFLSFPLPSTLYPQGAYTAGKINSVVDHQMDTVYSHKDGKILSFTGEVFVATATYPAGGVYQCYPKQANAVWSATLQGLYKGTGQSGAGSADCRVNKALNYEAHPGYDYLASSGTVVKAAAGGRVVNNLIVTTGQNNSLCVPKGLNGTTYKGCAAWGAVGIDHGNGYVTQYLHLSRIDVQAGQAVTEGQQIGLSGTTAAPNSPHLHFEVLKLRSGASNNYQPDNYVVVDPYGYDTSTGISDYLAQVTGVTNVRLWK